MKDVTCVWCQRKLAGSSPHVLKCGRAPDISKNDKKLAQIIHEVGFAVNDSWMREKYLTEGLSPLDLKERYNISPSQTHFLLGLFSIPKRGISEARTQKQCRDKQRQTNLDRFGVDNPSQNEGVKRKKEASFMDRYGVDNVFKDPEFQQGRVHAMIEKYGKGSLGGGEGVRRWWSTLSDTERKEKIDDLHSGGKNWWEALPEEEKERRVLILQEALKKCPPTPRSSKIEGRIGRSLERLGHPFKTQYFIDRKSYDFCLTGKNLLLEVQGDYWHANPQIYGPEEELRFPMGKTYKARELWAKDIQKKESAMRYGFTVLELWEGDIPSRDADLDGWLQARLSDLLRR